MSIFISFVETVFGGAWKLFGLQVPGFGFTYADIIVALILVSGAWLLFRMIMGTPGGSNSGTSSLGRSTRNPKISKERMNDEK